MLKQRFYFPGMKDEVKRYIDNCQKCKRAHVPRAKQPSLLHPLPVPDRPWQHITMDLKSFPKDKHSFDSCFVIMDRLCKQAYSLPCHKIATVKDLANLYLKHPYREGRLPESITSDRGPQFISDFWEELCRILGIKVKLSTAFHPQTDGQTEIMNQYLDQRLRPFINHYQDNWSEMLPTMDYAQLTLPHSTIELSPFEVLNGYPDKMSFDWDTPPTTNPKEKLNKEEAIKLATRMHDGWQVAKDAMEKAQEKKRRDINSH